MSGPVALAVLEAAAILLGAIGAIMVAKAAPAGLEMDENGFFGIDVKDALPGPARRAAERKGWMIIGLAVVLQLLVSLAPVLGRAG